MADKDDFISSADDDRPPADPFVRDTQADVNPYNTKPANSSSASVSPVVRTGPPRVHHRPDDLYYDMSGMKHLVIFNHHTYQNSKFFKKTPEPRVGTDEDVKFLRGVFEDELGFHITVHNDLDYVAIWKTFIKMYETDYSDVSCMCIVILTHGSYNGELYAADRSYDLREVIKLFERNTTLANKPKLFFVQACRGKETDAGITVCFDGDQNPDAFVTPTQADFLVMRSTVEDYISYRDIRGSWMIQELCHAIRKHYREWELLQIITLAHQKVAYSYKTYTPKNNDTNDKKQVPETCFTLTKLFKFQ